MTFEELAEQGVRFIFITLAAQHAMGMGFSRLLEDLELRKQDAYLDLQRAEWEGGDLVPTRSHHLFSGVPYHQHMGEALGSAAFGTVVATHVAIGSAFARKRRMTASTRVGSRSPVGRFRRTS